MTADELSTIVTLIGVVLAAIIAGAVAVVVQLMKSRTERQALMSQMRPNGGSTMRDAVDRIEARQAEQHEQTLRTNDRQDRQIEELRSTAESVALRMTRDVAEVQMTINKYHPEP